MFGFRTRNSLRVRLHQQQQPSYPFLHTTDTTTQSDQPSVNEVKICKAMTYVPKLSESLSHVVKEKMSNITMAPRPPYKFTRVFSNLKQPIPTAEKCDVIYDIRCNDCDKKYIGETMQKAKNRIQQHNRSCRATIQTNANSTALAKHAIELGHTFGFDNVKVLCKENTKTKLQIQEINHIVSNEDACCNFKTDSDHVTPIFYNLIKNCKMMTNNIKRDSNIPDCIS